MIKFKEKSFIEEIIHRWQQESPIFWKRVLNYSVLIGSSATSVIGADKLLDLQSYGVNRLIFTICGYIIAVCFGLGFGAKITKK